ncbi:MAG: amidohydrolase family protein [Alistipes sp.]|nr:amidohydrolase family protein [Alistipes sp.]
MRRIASHYALINGALQRDIVIELDDNGVIRNVIHTNALDSMASVEFYPGILIPGMVNAHCHLELSYLRGEIAEGSGFAGFARAIGQVRNNFTAEERIHAASVADARMWAEGVEAVADIANDELIMEVKERSKIAYHTMFEHFGLTNTSTAETQALALRYNDSSATPHSTYSLQDAPFKELCKGEELLSIHLLESDDESELYRGGGSLWAWYERMGWRCDFLDYGSPARRVAESTPRDRAMLLVHATRATKEDVELIESHTHSATWVLCPESNRYISRLTPPVAMLRDMGARIAVGTDSLASARSLSMIDNLRQLGDIAPTPLNELLTWATLNGAIALGIDAEKGSFEVGKRPGMVVIEGADLQNLRLTPNTTSRRLI